MAEDRIEISQEVAISASVAFWIDRAEWLAMTPESRKAKIEEHVAAAAHRFDSDVLTIDGSTNLCATISKSEGSFEVYDPDGLVGENGDAR